MNPEAPMTAIRLGKGTSIAQTLSQTSAKVTRDSPAMSVMTDLTQVRAATTVPTTGLRQAEQMMIHQSVRMLFVATAMPSLEGLVTSNDVSGDKPMRLVNERNVHFDELTVADVMRPVEALDALDLAQLKIASVGNLITSLKQLGRNHLLVVENPGDPASARICGVISRSQIERQLGEPIVITDIANSFSEIERALL